MNIPTPRSSSAKGGKLAERLSDILALLHQGGSIDKHDLARRFGVDVRTIERDFSERLRDIVKRSSTGHWQLAHHRRSTIPAQYLNGYAQLTGTEHLFPDPSLPYLLEQLETPVTQRATHVQSPPHENLDRQNITFALLQNAIEQRYECRFVYKEKSRLAQPYRLIHKNGVWYLAAEEGGRLKNFSVALIEALQVDESSRFTTNLAHHDYINGKDDVWFTTETTEVLLRVAPEVAHYFTRRPLLPRQQYRTDDDGSLLVTTHISHPQQLLPVVRHWLPYVRIIQPIELHQAVVESLRQALAMWEIQ